ncbi:MAG: chemotaxis protein CheW [Ignavibacteria bacterium]|nr:chemotaxis protein CheW [Ignavibacteria bacterium]
MITNKQPLGTPGCDQEILRNRARAIALPLTVGEESSGLEVLHFQLAFEQYAIEAKYVLEVIPLKEITPLPHTPAFVLGLINLRGEVMSVLDIRKFFNLPGSPISDLNRVIILRDGAMTFGILVDRIRGIQLIPESSIIKNTANLGATREEYLIGITTDRLIVLNGKALISDKKIILQYDD